MSRRLASAACGGLSALARGTALLAPDAESIRAQRATRTPLTNVGLPIGARIPRFEAPDQDGRVRDFDSVRGPNGAVIYFYRSADWCIYCRAQLVETEAAREALRRNGLGVVGISYDSPEVLKQFADEKRIGFPLLSDPESAVIRAFDVLDANALPGSPAYGVPYHGNYIVDASGTVLAKLFDVEATLSHSTGVVVSRLFGSPMNTHVRTVTHDRLSLRYWASANSVAPGHEVELTVEVRVNDGLHVYAPQPGRYIPVDWQLELSPAFDALPTAMPAPQKLAMVGTNESAAVYTGVFQLLRRIRLSTDELAVARAVDPQGNFAVKGSFSFQACDHEKCFLPTTVALEWRLAEQPAAPSHAH
jgi:peroxiredoxin